MKRFLLVLASLLIGVSFLSAQTASISGKVTEKESKAEILYAAVALSLNGVIITSAETDLNGNYHLANLDPGIYDLEFYYLGFHRKKMEKIQVFDAKFMRIDIEMEGENTLLPEITVTYEAPLIDADPGPGPPLTGVEIRRLPFRDLTQIVATAAGTTVVDGEISMRHSRSNATKIYIDGMPTLSNLIPESDVSELQIMTGGISARYGDVTGGIISIVTKGPSEELSGGVELETSQFLDPYNHNLVGVNLSGPLLRNKKDDATILGFRLSGRYTYREDDSPSAVPIYRIKDEALSDLQDNPVIFKGGNVFTATDFLTNEDVNVLKTRPFEDLTRYDLTAKLDARFSKAIDVSMGGSLSSNKDQFTPNENSKNIASSRTLNAHNNPIDIRDDYRFNFRFRHRLGNAMDDQKNALIQYVNYTLQASYEKRKRGIADPDHQNNYFDYGYIGQFDIDYIPVFQVDADDPNRLVHIDYREVLRGYDPTNSTNPVLANYNNPFNLPINETLNPDQPNLAIQGGAGNVNNTTLDDLYAINGRVSNIFDNAWGLHQNVGAIYNRSLRRDNDVFVFNANAAFDLVPSTNEKGRHKIRFGIAYENRVNREYDVRDPRRLWTAARQNANAHIQGIDVENATVIGLHEGFELLSLTLTEDPDARFYKSIRESLSLDLDQYVNIDGLAPNQLRMDMFSARELNDQFILDYYGYDYLGNEYNGTFNDFFTARDPDGIRSFPVAPSRPLYTSFYLQDKFIIKDIIFRVGVRMDRYDANTKVLKDPYSLYAIKGAADFHNQYGGSRPGNIGDNFRVYTVTDNGDQVQAYRQGDDWFHADGTPANGAQEIQGIRTGLVFPKYQDDAAHTANYIKSEKFDTDASFKDYEVQVNIMPRLSFSFPISDKANFFAHYDILVQRPPSNTIATALDYFYFTERTGTQTFNNPNLKPERTVDYEVGFQQLLTTSSSIKIAAFYKEMRDMIQLRTFFPVPIVGSYTTFDNQDFGTVKGFSFSYNMRRTRNMTINANYTLQFADGTGSDSESQRGLTNRGNIRTLFPLNSDERHHFNFSADYRVKEKQGPYMMGLYPLANAGVNFHATAVSGRPYTSKNVVAEELGGVGTVGGINTARKPWVYTLNMRIDKQLHLGDKLNLNIYLRVSNLLNTHNTIDVYPVTGSSEDDGFLDSSFGQDQLQAIANSAREIEAYQASYQWRLLNSDFFSLPRQIFMGAIMDF